ncbi:hypothetical protein FQN57_006212 [Myotisia sp. PD_48]|nr:hypothetical protein FQN57_006212 [Myotisia sp. PD_48]
MVSHPESVDRSTAHRPPASVSSSRHSRSNSYTNSRHHRYASSRSHHGGSAHQSINEFPTFATTGDVEIVIQAADQERRYLLHRLILAQNSGFFEAGTSDEWSKAQPQRRIAANAAFEDGLETDRTPHGSQQKSLSIIQEVDDGHIDDNDDNGTVLRCSLDSRRSNARPAGSSSTGMRWRYELDWDNREDEKEMPILVQKPPSNSSTLFGQGESHKSTVSQTKPVASNRGFLRSMANLAGIQSALHLPSTDQVEEQKVDPTIRDYDNLFRIFYNYTPQLNSVNIAAAYSECKSLLTLADMYDALPVTGPRVDHHLLRFSSRLYKQIAKYPPSYLRLGYLARSRVIFSEALVHVVGQWPLAKVRIGPSSYAPFPDSIIELIEDKVEDLEDEIARVEGKLFRVTLTTSRGERVSPANAYLDWLAVSLFRHWLVEQTSPPLTSILKPLPNPNRGPNISSPHSHISYSHMNGNGNGTTRNHGLGTSARHTGRPLPDDNIPEAPHPIGRTYRLIGSSNPQAYLNHEDLKRFLKSQPSSESLYTRENMKRFERKMDEIKRLARQIVKPLMRNFLELDLKGTEEADGSGVSVLPYLTCTQLHDSDYPWY